MSTRFFKALARNPAAAQKERILSLGSGDGSQQVALVKLGLESLITTFHQSREEVLQTHLHARKNLDYLSARSRNAPIFQIDATQVHRHFPHKYFANIFFSFPHNGMSLTPWNRREVQDSNRELICRVVSSASHNIATTGQIDVVLKDSSFYDKFHPTPDDLQRSGLFLLSQEPHEFLPGHQPCTTLGKNKYGGKIPVDAATVLSFIPAASIRMYLERLTDEEAIQDLHDSMTRQQVA